MTTDQPDPRDARAAEAKTMTVDQLRRALRPLNLNVQGGLSRATRADLVNWYVMNTPRPRRTATPFDNQDRAGSAGGKRGLFHDGQHLADIPAEDVSGAATRAIVAAELGIPEGQIEALLVCLEHPTTSAVDCTTCAPE
jgi:hypothetical protein